MLKRHFENIITSLRHPITNGSPIHQPPLFPSASSAVPEGLNSKIQAIKANARGFRSFFNYRTRILFLRKAHSLPTLEPVMHFLENKAVLCKYIRASRLGWPTKDLRESPVAKAISATKSGRWSPLT